MKIERIDVALYRVPLPVVLSDSIHGLMPDFELITARVHTSDGAEGLGYTYTVGRGGQAIRAMIEADLAPALLGRDARATEALWQELWWRVHWVGRGGVASFAIAALDVALWDLKAKAAHEPLWRLLGGEHAEVPAYAGGIDLDFSLGQLRAQTERFLAEGHQAIKVKAGRPQLHEDVERVRIVRDLIGPDVTLMVDANCRWSVAQAIEASRALAPCRLLWLEEPTDPDDVDGFARIAREGQVAVATGENLHTVKEFERMMRLGCVAYPQPDLATLGGITPWLKVASLAQATQLPVTSHGVHDLHVHLLAAVPNGSYLELHGFGLERFQREPLAVREGHATAPSRPGHGVDLNWSTLEPYRDVTTTIGRSVVSCAS